MITLITGVPGSGKTLYIVDKILRDVVGKTVSAKDKHGNKVDIVRTIYSNIKGLMIEHEFIDAGWLENWHTNTKPGDLIVYDEVQECWPPRPNGAKVPEHIGKLETHRHLGVDFVLATQGPMLIDRNVLQLVGRHLHIRRVSSVGAAVVYEWDHCSRSLLYKNAMTKWPWRYDKSVFQLYKSAELHTKQTRKLPGLVWFILLGAIAFPILGYRTYQNIWVDAGKAKTAAQAGGSSVLQPPGGGSTATAQPLTPVQYAATFTPRIADIPHSAPRYDQLAQPTEPPVVAACIEGRNQQTKKHECSCFTQQATPVTVSREVCHQFATRGMFQDFKTPSQLQAQQAQQAAQRPATPPQTAQQGVDPQPAPPPPQTVAAAVLHEAKPPDRGQVDGEVFRAMAAPRAPNALR